MLNVIKPDICSVPKTGFGIEKPVIKTGCGIKKPGSKTGFGI